MTKRIIYKDKNISIYVDTNVLRNFCTGQKADVECMNFLFSKRKKNKLFTSTLAVAQALSGVQNKKLTKNETISKGSLLSGKMTFIDFCSNDITDSFTLIGDDLEDNMHYLMSKKKQCVIIVTNDKTGFAKYNDVIVVKPTKLGYLRSFID